MRVGLIACAALLLCGALFGLALPGLLLQPAPAADSGLQQAANLELYICPEDDCAERLVEFIGSAGESVHVMVYSFTEERIAEALVEAMERGVEVRVVVEKTQAAGAYSKDEFLAGKGVAVREVNPAGYAIMHHKVLVVDGNAFSTGSFNYTKNADSGNAENLLIVRSRALAQRMESEFGRLWLGECYGCAGSSSHAIR